MMRAFMSTHASRFESDRPLLNAVQAELEARRILAETEPPVGTYPTVHNGEFGYWPSGRCLADALRVFVGEGEKLCE